MKKVFEYSHLGGLEILKVRYPHIEQEIDEIIDSIKITGRTKISKEKHKIKAFKQIDFLKERILVEVQFGKWGAPQRHSYPFPHRNMLSLL